jgi:hypothetical protein
MNIDTLPHYIEDDIEYEDGTIRTWKFFLSINRDFEGRWSCGYVHYASDEVEDDTEMVIPQLFFNSADSLEEIAVRMDAKVKRFKKLREQ